MMTRLSVDGMHCDGCVRRVRKLLERAEVSGVGDVAIGCAEIQGDASAIEKAIAALTEAGYDARVERQPP